MIASIIYLAVLQAIWLLFILHFSMYVVLLYGIVVGFTKVGYIGAREIRRFAKDWATALRKKFNEKELYHDKKTSKN